MHAGKMNEYYYLKAKTALFYNSKKSATYWWLNPVGSAFLFG